MKDRHPLPSALVHDMRTPLNQIIGYTELLMEQAEDAGEHASLPYLKKVRAAGLQMLAIMDENIDPVAADHRSIPGVEVG